MTAALMTLDVAQAEPAARIGGKAASLARLWAAGMPVPPAAVLPTEFFEPWLQMLRASPQWAGIEAGGDGALRACRALQAQAGAFRFDARQLRTLAALTDLAREWGEAGAAVRSSAPQEDLATASFAGLYRSRLGVPLERLAEAVRDCFVSALDARVWSYKETQGLDPTETSIAVLVQQQLASDVAGVAFSLNPLNNDHDEGLIAAAPGLGDKVVDGRVQADQLRVCKVSGAVIEQRLGEASAGTACLAGARLADLIRLVCEAEQLFGVPVDVEWAVADDRVWLLQARPITRYFPVPEALASKPGERRRLYADAGIDQGLTSNAPLSAMGLDVMDLQMKRLLGRSTKGAPSGRDGLLRAAGNRTYLSLSPLLYLQSPARLAESPKLGQTNLLGADILRGVDRQRYRTRHFPWRFLAAGLRAAWAVAPLVLYVPGALLFTGRFERFYRHNNQEFEQTLAEADYALPVGEFCRRNGDALVTVLRRSTLPALCLLLLRGPFAVQRLLKRATGEERALLQRLDGGMQGDQVIEMDLAIWRAAGLLPDDAADDLDALATRLEARDLPEPFLGAWDHLLARFGHRGANETDVRMPRFRDQPRQLLGYLLAMRRGGAGYDPQRRFACQVAARRAAHARLLATASWRRRRKLRRMARTVSAFADARNLAKEQMVQVLAAVRRRLLEEGEALVAVGRLDAPDDVFDLELADLERPGDLRAIRDRHRQRRELLERRVRQFPLVVDSRGRILRPRESNVGSAALKGHGVSPGTARGRVRVLHEPGGATVQPGEVLVAYVTDPGWTPLFVSSAALVLEVGGPIQHGVLVARELGKPCVVGISGITERLRDGEMVDVDGDRGTVTRVAEA